MDSRRPVMPAAAYAETMTEHQLHLVVLEAAKWAGWTVHFIPDWMFRQAIKNTSNKYKDWMDKGFPDLVLGREHEDGTCELVVVELKTKGGSRSKEQVAWGRILSYVLGDDYMVIKPKDLERLADRLGAQLT